jgi:hypothetical protein
VERRDAVAWKECEILFKGSETGSLEVDPAMAGRGKEVVAGVGLAVQRVLGKAAIVKVAQQISGRRTQECPVDWG